MLDQLKSIVRKSPCPTPETNELSPESSSTERDFSLHSGERQTATDLEDIRFDHFTRYEMVARQLDAQWSGKPNLFGLDAFCGTGYGSYMITSEIGGGMLGIDASEEAIAFANEHYGRPSLYFATKRFPFELPRNTFDYVVCLESVEHIRDDAGFVAQLDRSLKEQGLLFLSTPNATYLSLEINPHPFHFKHYTYDDVIALIQGLGSYEVVTWYGQDHYLLESGKVVDVLPVEGMVLHERAPGQTLVFVFRKRASC